eukprot:GEMP01062783.1.p1 GENE.GEMP01062783.1~~GEMP01062783.1.p1  ORF type:complete len:256 (+),score=59.90 GEMP01062783.1:52-819(+)
MKVRTHRDELGAGEPGGTLDASLCSATLIDEIVKLDLPSFNRLDISHNDLCSPDGAVETAILMEQRKKVNAKAVITEGELVTQKSHKEKDFAVGAAKRRQGKEMKEKGEAALQEANDELGSLHETMQQFPWSALLASGLPRELVANNCGLKAANLQLMEEGIVGQMTKVSLNGNYFGDDGATEVAEIIRKSNHLQELSVQNTGLTDIGVSVILAVLVSNTTLTRLDLRCNHLATKASDAAIKGMRHFNKTATVLF